MSIEDVMRMLFVMRDDLEAASVRDVVLRGPDGIQAVLTLSTEFFSDQTTEYVLGGTFAVLGKVTSIVRPGEAINLTRRTALGIAGPDTARDLVESYTSDNKLFVEISDPIVEPPGLQILPLAVFV